MAFILPQNNNKTTISQPSGGRLFYSFVSPASVSTSSSGLFELAQMDMTRNANFSTFSFRKIFRERVNQLGGGAFDAGYDEGFDT